jgi:hypothetical protein
VIFFIDSQDSEKKLLFVKVEEPEKEKEHSKTQEFFDLISLYNSSSGKAKEKK